MSEILMQTYNLPVLHSLQGTPAQHKDHPAF